jgi:hypothetical protein
MTMIRALHLLYIAAWVLSLVLAGGETPASASSSLFGTKEVETAAAAAGAAAAPSDFGGRKMQSSSSSYRNETDCIIDAETKDFVCVTQMFGTGDVLESCEQTINEKACSNCTLCPSPSGDGTTGYQLDCSNIVGGAAPSPDQCFPFFSSSVPSSSGGGVSSMRTSPIGAVLLAVAVASISFLVFGG